MAYKMYFSSLNIWFRKSSFPSLETLFNKPLQCSIVSRLLRTAARVTFSSAKIYHTCSSLDSFIHFILSFDLFRMFRS